MKVHAPFQHMGEHIAIDLPGARAVFTSRRGGVSTGPYRSLNLGRWTDDDPEAVRQNRELLQQQLGISFAFGRQVHGATVTRVEELPDPEAPPARADGQATALPRVGALVLTADCLPIAISSPGAVAMLHAGWRGLEAGVIEEGVRAIRQLGGDAELSAAIGPGAGVCCYQVGEELHSRFVEFGPAARNGDNLDLKAIARLQLQEAGVSRIHDAGICTICSRRFYSHRREHGVTGRQAGIAWLT